MPNVPYKYLKDEHNTTFYPMIGPASFNDAMPISKGGTGATTAMDARKNLGVAGGTMYFKDQVVSAATNAEILRITDSSITSDTIVVESVWYGPVTITSWTSYDGYIAFNGTCNNATTADITLSIVDVPAQSAPLSITKGGTGANTAAEARSNLGVAKCVIESGTQDGWIYDKWSDNTITAYKIINETIASYTTVTTGLYGYYKDVSLPFTMANTNYLIFNSWRISSSFAWGAMTLSETTTNVRVFGISTLQGSQQCLIRLYLQGELATS